MNINCDKVVYISVRTVAAISDPLILAHWPVDASLVLVPDTCFEIFLPFSASHLGSVTNLGAMPILSKFAAMDS